MSALLDDFEDDDPELDAFLRTYAPSHARPRIVAASSNPVIFRGTLDTKMEMVTGRPFSFLDELEELEAMEPMAAEPPPAPASKPAVVKVTHVALPSRSTLFGIALLLATAVLGPLLTPASVTPRAVAAAAANSSAARARSFDVRSTIDRATKPIGYGVLADPRASASFAAPEPAPAPITHRFVKRTPLRRHAR